MSAGSRIHLLLRDEIIDDFILRATEYATKLCTLSQMTLHGVYATHILYALFWYSYEHTHIYVLLCMCWVAFINFTAASCMPHSPVSFLWQLVFAFVVLFLFSNSFHFWFMHSNSVCLSISCIFTHSLPVTGTHTHTLTYWVCLLLFMKCSYSSAWAATVFWCQRHTEVYRGGLQRMCKHRCKANLFFCVFAKSFVQPG